MKVKEIMTTDVGICLLDGDLIRAVEIMRQKNCGVVPVADAENRIVGILTDRDVCLAVAALNKKFSAIKVKEIISGKVVVCAPDDKIEIVLKKMRKFQIKRLPVVDRKGEIAGILSMTDVLLSVRKDKAVKKQIYSTLKGIVKPQPIVLREVIAAVEADGE